MVEPKIFIERVNYFYGDFQALRNITLEVPPRSVTAFFGPAGGGKSTLLRLINRLNDMVEDTRMTGRVLLDGKNVYDPDTNVASLRRRVGMVFALPLPLPGTVRENVIYGLKLASRDGSENGGNLGAQSQAGRFVGRDKRPARRAPQTPFPEASNKGFASPGALRWSRRCCCSTNRPPVWTLFQRERSRDLCSS